MKIIDAIDTLSKRKKIELKIFIEVSYAKNKSKVLTAFVV